MNEQNIVELVKSDEWMMNVLHEAEKLNLPNWMIGAGFLRNKVWDYLHGINREVADINDIDLVYFDSEHVSEEADRVLSEKMNGTLGVKWEIVNQAYTHSWHNRSVPYIDTVEGVSEWVETPTCVAVTLQDGEPVIYAPHGLSDLVNLVVRPTSSQKDDLDLFYKRIKDKEWLKKWPKLKVKVD